MHSHSTRFLSCFLGWHGTGAYQIRLRSGTTSYLSGPLRPSQAISGPLWLCVCFATLGARASPCGCWWLLLPSFDHDDVIAETRLGLAVLRVSRRARFQCVGNSFKLGV